MRGASGIPELRLEVLQGVINAWNDPPNVLFSNMFPTTRAASDTIVWESQLGSRALAPFVAPGEKSPKISAMGVAQHTAKAAFMKEAMHFDEEFLNNLRRAGTYEQYLTSKEILANNLFVLKNRMFRRKEWMFSKMLCSGSFEYLTKGGHQLSVDYGVPTAHNVTLAADKKWNTGSSRDILGDITDARETMMASNGATITHAFLNSKTLRYLAEDPLVRNILQKSTFGDGGLFRADDMGKLIGINAKVIGNLLNLDNFVVYDEQYQIRTHLTAALAASGTTVYLEETMDIEAGDTLRIWDADDESYEDLTVSSVDAAAGTVTVSTGPTYAYKAREDYVTVTRYFVPTNKFVMLAQSVSGQPVAEYVEAPFGLDRHYGLKVDQNEEWDPEGIDIRVQQKGLPVLKQKDAVYILTVA